MDTAVEEGEGGTYGERNMETYITICKRDSQWELAIWLRELKPVLCNNLEGWNGEGSGGEVQEGGDIRIPMTGFILMYGRIQHNSVKQSSFNLKKQKLQKIKFYIYLGIWHFWSFLFKLTTTRLKTSWTKITTAHYLAFTWHECIKHALKLPWCFHLRSWQLKQLHWTPIWLRTKYKMRYCNWETKTGDKGNIYKIIQSTFMLMFQIINWSNVKY